MRSDGAGQARRAVIYARFSTELQHERSIADQVELCRAHAHRDGLIVVAVHEDRARSGASLLGRPGLATLMQAAEAQAFDVVVVEALDRLSRDIADLAGLHRRLQFLGIEIRAVHDGVADTITIGLRGLVGQLYREDGAKKVRRGMQGVIRDGRHPGGRAYGYRPVAGAPGRLRIDEAEAAVVRRIFADYAAGRSPRDIAGDLNRDGVTPPRGATWNASTINGNRRRANGIVQNALYGGEIVWNRVRMVKDPATGRRVSRPNPESEWMRADAPDLAIVDPQTLADARARKGANIGQRAPSGPRRTPRSPLSGLLKCGACGGGMSKHDRNGGRPRVRCSRAHESGDCANARPVYLDRIEEGVLAGLTAELDHPEIIAEYVRAYHAERQRLAGAEGRDRRRDAARRAEIDRQMARFVDAIGAGASAFGDLRHRMEELEAERRAIDARLAAQEDSDRVVTLHPQAIASFRRTLTELGEAIRADAAPTALAHAAFRQLVERVVVHTPEPGEQPRVEIVGRLAAILRLPGLGAPQNLGGLLVAEDRYSSIPLRFTLVWAV